MYHGLKKHFWWNAMKRETAQYAAKCLVCQQVKVKHQRVAGPLKPLPISQWQLEHVTINFVRVLISHIYCIHIVTLPCLLSKKIILISPIFLYKMQAHC